MENEKTLLKSVANISKELMEEQEKVLGRLCLGRSRTKKKAAEKLLKIAKIYEEKDDEKKFLLILKSGSLEPAILFALNKDLIRNDEERCDLSRINEILQDEMLDKRNRAEHQTIIAGKKLGKEQSTHAFLTVLDCSLLASNAGKSLLSRILKERICQRADLETAKSGQKDKKRALYDKKDPFSFEAQKNQKIMIRL